MKKRFKFLALATVMFAFTAGAFAQVSATAAASATIVSPIAIARATDMNFGNVAVSTSGGTVVLTPALAANRTTTGGVTLPATTGTVTAAAFNVTGTPSYTYTIALSPATITITNPASNTMTVTGLTSNPASTGTLDAGGAQTIYVGGTLNVSGGQATGTYTNATAVTVTVNYN